MAVRAWRQHRKPIVAAPGRSAGLTHLSTNAVTSAQQEREDRDAASKGFVPGARVEYLFEEGRVLVVGNPVVNVRESRARAMMHVNIKGGGCIAAKYLTVFSEG